MNRTTDNSGSKVYINETVETFPDIPLAQFSGISVAIFAVIGIIANVLVILVIFMSKRKQFSTYRILISHLALADLLCSIMLIVYVPVEINHHQWMYSDLACKFIYPSITFFETLAIGTVIIISFERYKGVILPHWAQWKFGHVCAALGIVYLLAFIVISPNVIVIRVTYYKNINYCNEYWKNIAKPWQEVYGMFFFLTAFFLPALSIAVMHVHIMYRLKKRSLRPSNESNYRDRTDNRIVRVLTGIILAFFICTSPNKILYLVWDIFPKLENDTTARTRYYLRTFQILYYARVAVDPLLYCFFDTRFKLDFQNTTKTMRGVSVTDSDMSRSRNRTLSSQPPSSNVNDSSASAAAIVIANACAGDYVISYSGLLSTVETPSSQPTSLTIIHEATALNTPVVRDVQIQSSDKRSRTESIITENTSVYGSSSPFGLSSLMTEQ